MVSVHILKKMTSYRQFENIFCALRLELAETHFLASVGLVK